MKLVTFASITFFLLGCGNKEYRYSYYEDGEIKMKTELKNGVLDGELVEYYPNGDIKTRQEWKEGLADGQWKSFFRSGNLSKEAYFKEDKILYKIDYFESGKVRQKVTYDSLNYILTLNMFREDGTIEEHPLVAFCPHDEDTFLLGTVYNVRFRIVNVGDSLLYKNGRIIITSGFDPLNYAMPLDTIKTLYPQNDYDYMYGFVPEKVGLRHIYGLCVFEKDVGEDIVRIRFPFEYRYYGVYPEENPNLHPGRRRKPVQIFYANK